MATNQDLANKESSNQDPGNQDPANQDPDNKDPDNKDPTNKDPANTSVVKHSKGRVHSLDPLLWARCIKPFKINIGMAMHCDGEPPLVMLIMVVMITKKVTSK